MRTADRPRHRVSHESPGGSSLPDKTLEQPGVDRCALFQGIGADERAEIRGAAARQQFEPRELIIGQGEPAQALCLLLAGRAKQSQARLPASESVVCLLGPGDLCGWPSVLMDDVSPVTVRAIELTRALVWSRAVFEGFFDRLPTLSRNALRLLARQLGEQDDRYRELALERVPQRLARTLLRLVRPVGRRQDDRLLTEVPLSRAELAQMTGTTLFTVSRVVAEWEGRGLLEAHRGSLTVTDVPALESIAAGSVDDPSVPLVTE